MAENRPDRLGVVGLCIVGGAAAILSLSIVRELAVAAGIDQRLGFLLWVSLDIYAGIAVRTSFKAQTAKVRLWAAASAVFSLLLSAGAAGCHVFIDGGLPQPLAFGILCTPALMLGLSLHLVLLLSLERRPEPEPTLAAVPAQAEVVCPQLEERQDEESTITEETVTRRQVTTSRRSGKSAAFVAALKAADPPGSLTVTAVVNQINPTLDDPLHDASARKLVALYRRGEIQ